MVQLTNLTKLDSALTSVGDFTAQAFPSLLQGALGISEVQSGISLTQQGAEAQALSFVAAGNASMAAAEYNAGIEQIKLNRTLTAASRNIARTLGEQKTSMAMSGVSSTSKSFLQVSNEALDVLSQEIINLKMDSEINQQQILFQGQIDQTASLNQAITARYAGQVSAYQQAQQAGQQIAGLGTSVVSLAAQSFGSS